MRVFFFIDPAVPPHDRQWLSPEITCRLQKQALYGNHRPLEAVDLGLHHDITDWEGLHLLLADCESYDAVVICVTGDAVGGPDSGLKQAVKAASGKPVIAYVIHMQPDTQYRLLASDVVFHVGHAADKGTLAKMVPQAMAYRKKAVQPKFGPLTIDLANDEVMYQGEPWQISRREKQTFIILARYTYKGCAITKEKIAEHIYRNEKDFPDLSSVETYVSKLRGKLRELSPGLENIIRSTRYVGYRLVDYPGIPYNVLAADAARFTAEIEGESKRPSTVRDAKLERVPS